MESKTRDINSDVRLKIDKDGRWYYGEQEITHPGVLKAFQSALSCDEHGIHTVTIDNEICTVEVCDAPLIALTLREDSQGFLLILAAGEIHRLNPLSLKIGLSGAFYADGPRGLEIKFSRAAHNLLALSIEDDGSNYLLKIATQTYRLHLG